MAGRVVRVKTSGGWALLRYICSPRLRQECQPSVDLKATGRLISIKRQNGRKVHKTGVFASCARAPGVFRKTQIELFTTDSDAWKSGASAGGRGTPSVQCGGRNSELTKTTGETCCYDLLRAATEASGLDSESLSMTTYAPFRLQVRRPCTVTTASETCRVCTRRSKARNPVSLNQGGW